ncbi:ArsR/SmtB family transcription factor [Corynebacterium godavarianum]|uniref:ArsR/SmtB family transcription factor n=1 Tax=Corynebacterium godavarianum TaxID=2054421 RepID=UPI001EE4D1C1|nr:metalloregulator ArsR/SmtB family transcription factor [Corynebacterium godavarianum]
MARRKRSAPANLDATAELISALNSELRLQILLMLYNGDHVVHELVANLKKSQPLISQHLRVLKSAGLVTSSRSGREVIYSLVVPEAGDVIFALSRAATRVTKVAEEADAERDDLAAKRSAREHGDAPTSPGAGAGMGAAIMAPPTMSPTVAPTADPGIVPQTPRQPVE